MNLDPALAALSAALNGAGPGVELLADAGPDGYRVETAADAPQETAAVVRTSGSTGTPKRTILPVDALAASSMATALELGVEGQWLLALPLNYVAGLSVLSRSLYAGTRPWAMAAGESFTARAFADAAGEMTDRVRLTSLVPTQLRRLLADPEPGTLAALRRFDAILLGGGRAPDALRAEARRQGLRVRLTYGMSETCGGCVYDGVPLPGVRAREEDGRLWLGGDVVAGGYLGDPELTAAHFRTDDDGVRWFRAEDLGDVDAAGVRVHGRADDVVITGGIKVSAGAVQRVVEAVPGVRDALVVGVPDAEWGAAVAALVVGDAEDAAIADAVRSELGAAAVPRRIHRADAVPLLTNGKPDRRRAVGLLGGTGESAGA